MYLTGAAYDMWKGLFEEKKKDTEVIKRALRDVFWLRRIDAWHSALSRKVFPGETINVAVVADEEIKKLIKTRTDGSDPKEYTVSSWIPYPHRYDSKLLCNAEMMFHTKMC